MSIQASKQINIPLPKRPVACVRAGVVLALCFASPALWAADEGLRNLLGVVEVNHPLIRAARHNYEATLEDVEAIKRRRWPTISASVESDTGSRQMAQVQTLQVEQKLWDKGQLSSQIAESEAIASGSNVFVDMERQRIFLDVVSAWQSYVAAEAKRRIALDMTFRLMEYKEMMRRRVQAEVSPFIDLEVVESRLLQASVEQEQAQSSAKIGLAKLSQLSGLDEQAIVTLLRDSIADEADTRDIEACISQECWRDELESHPSVVKARWDVKAMERRLNSKESESWPVAYLRLAQPVDIGTGSANKINMQSSVFLGLRYTTGAGFEASVQARSLAARLAGAQEAVDSAIREVAVQFESDVTDILSSKLRFAVQQRAVRSAVAVLDSYTSQFSAARKTWMDLLNAVRELSQNQYAMVDARASMASAMYRFQIRSNRLKDLQ